MKTFLEWLFITLVVFVIAVIGLAIIFILITHVSPGYIGVGFVLIMCGIVAKGIQDS